MPLLWGLVGRWIPAANTSYDLLRRRVVASSGKASIWHNTTAGPVYTQRAGRRPLCTLHWVEVCSSWVWITARRDLYRTCCRFYPRWDCGVGSAGLGLVRGTLAENGESLETACAAGVCGKSL